MSDMSKTGRARIFEQLRHDGLAEVVAPSLPEGERVKPLTAAQAEAICETALRSLQPR